MPRFAHPARRGVTLIELLVVLVLLAVTAAVVMPVLTPPSNVRDEDPTASVVAEARRVAITRGEPLRLRIDSDGVWALVTLHSGVAVDAGRLPAVKRSGTGNNATTLPVLVTIDPLGSCHPGDGDWHGRAYDPLSCRWSHVVARAAVVSTQRAP